jgi:hypothetical protein
MADPKNRQSQGCISSVEAVNNRSVISIAFTKQMNSLAGGRMPVIDAQGMGSKLKSRDYFLPDFFFAAQYAFNFADNFARVAVLNTVFLAAGLAETVGGFELRTFAHLAF